MAHLYRNTVTRYVDSEGKRVDRHAPGARKVSERSKVWYGRYRDGDSIERRVKLFTNKAASRQALAELERKAELAKAGVSNPFEAHARRPLAEHLAEFVASLENAGRSADYVQPVESRVRRIVDGCRFRFIGDISASSVQAYLAEQKRGGLGQRTVNHYLQAVKQFTKWLVTDRRTNDNRLAHLKAGNAKMDVRRERRELDDGEIRRLLETACTCTRHGFTLSGWQRFTLYATALETGLRASELASLTPAHFDLETDPPTVRIDAADEKARRGDVLPLPADLVAILKPWLAGMPPDAPVWPGTWADNKRAGKFMQSDLRAARKAWLAESADECERRERERSDFLKYHDSDGRYADFHALRHTYLSRLGRSGASAKAMQRLARHTTVELTIGRYTHANLFDLSAAVDRLPPLPLGDSPNKSAAELRATGTDGVQARDGQSVVGRMVGRMVGQTADSDCVPLKTIESGDGPEGRSNADSATDERACKTRVSEADCAPLRRDEIESGSGKESNLPDDFSAVTLGLKPRAVTPQPVAADTSCADGLSVVGRLVGRDSRKTPESDPRLARLMAAWPALPEGVRAKILALLDSA